MITTSEDQVHDWVGEAACAAFAIRPLIVTLAAGAAVVARLAVYLLAHLGLYVA